MAKKSAPSQRTDNARPRFMAILKRTANVSLACRALKLSRVAAYERREKDPEFAAEWDNAIAEAIDHLEGEAFRRAFKGCRKPVFQGGALVGHVKEYSDTLMTVLLKGHKPDRYREKVDNIHSGTMTIEIVKFSEVPEGGREEKNSE